MTPESETQNFEATVPADDALSPTETLLEFCDKNLSDEELNELFGVLVDNFCSPPEQTNDFLDVLKLIFRNLSKKQCASANKFIEETLKSIEEAHIRS